MEDLTELRRDSTLPPWPWAVAVAVAAAAGGQAAAGRLILDT